MRSDISIQGIAPVSSTGDPAPETKEPASGSTVGVGSVAAAPIYANPTLRLEPALGLVVIEFRDSAGALTNSFPSQRQLQAYKMHALGSLATGAMADVPPTPEVTPTNANGSAEQRPGMPAHQGESDGKIS